MSFYNVVSESEESTVVSEYKSEEKRSDAYQSEEELEKEFIHLLTEMSYEYLPIHNKDELLPNLRKKLPNRVVIDDYGMEAISNGYKLFVNMKSVVSVIDMGTWYTFKFDLKMNNFFVCQKDLLVEGTLEEFEKLFEGKIERKVKR